MRRAFGFDVLACPRCGRAMRLIALIEQAAVIRRILRHLGQPTEVPAPAPPLIATGREKPGADDGPGVVYDREPQPNYDEPC